MTELEVARLAWDKMNGLLPAVVQDRRTGTVLMVGYMSRESLARTLDSGLATFFSRSRERVWQKGETSGNVLRVKSIHPDCDGDALLVLADPQGPTCHLGTTSCFADVQPGGRNILDDLSRTVAERAASADPASSYTARLLAGGLPGIAQKIGEEGVEVALAAVTRDPAGCAEEISDLLYHLAVLLEARGIAWSDVDQVLDARHRSRLAGNTHDT